MQPEKDLDSQYASLVTNKNLFSMLGILNIFFIICALADMTFNFMNLVNLLAIYFCLKADIKNDIKLDLVKIKVDERND